MGGAYCKFDIRNLVWVLINMKQRVRPGGLRDWWLQRISAVLISLFALPVILYWVAGGLITQADWYIFLSHSQMRFLTGLGLLGYIVHVRIGLWVVVTDYIPSLYQAWAQWLVDILIALHLGFGLYLIWIF